MKQLSILVLLFTVLNSYAQSGTIKYTETRNLKIELSPEMQQYAHLIPTETVNHTELLFDKGQSLYQTVEEEEKEVALQANTQVQTISIGMGEEESVTFLDFNKKQSVLSKDLMGEIFLIKGELSAPNWKVKNEEKEILGYTCRLAEFTDKDITIKAWFTPQIAPSIGPSEYYGLPGTILEVSFSEEQLDFIIEATEVIIGELKDNISEPTKGKKVSPEKFNEIMEKQIQMIQNMSGSGSSESGMNVEIKIID